MNHLRHFIALVAFASLAAFGQPPSVHGEHAIAPKTAAAPALRLQAAPPVVSLAPVSDAELLRVRQANRAQQKRVAIGVVRDADVVASLPATPLVWHSVPGGYAAQAAVRSPDAGALRLAIDLAGVREDVTMVFYGSDAPKRLEGPVRVGDVRDRTVPYWSPITDGDTQTVEFFVPTAVEVADAPKLVGASHLFTTLASGLKATGLGQSESCEIDVKCSSLLANTAFANMRNSVARMVFNKSGTTFLCSGQLLNDTDPSSQLPWFLSGNHCFENTTLPLASASQMQTVANSLTTLWFFEAMTCSSPSDLTNPPSVQVSGGAAFIYNDPGDDTLLLRLNGKPPAGSFYAGWNADAVAPGAQVVVVHHPEGDVKKVAQGHVIAYSSPEPDPLGGARTPFSEVTYFSGTTEPGSSGSGLFTFDGTDYQLRGTLYSGGADCTAPMASDWYTRFDMAYPSLAQYLSPAGTNVDYSDLWFNPAESGWGLNIVQHASQNIFAVWFVFDANGKPMWYTLPGGGWTGPTTFAGTLFATTGPPASATSFNASSVKVREVGSATISFNDANHGTFSYTIDGVSGTKAISRQPF
jgi:lysyl endopeptidase